MPYLLDTRHAAELASRMRVPRNTADLTYLFSLAAAHRAKVHLKSTAFDEDEVFDSRIDRAIRDFLTYGKSDFAHMSQIVAAFACTEHEYRRRGLHGCPQFIADRLKSRRNRFYNEVLGPYEAEKLKEGVDPYAQEGVTA